jgi:conjugal transfer pilus assembly protein TraW
MLFFKRVIVSTAFIFLTATAASKEQSEQQSLPDLIEASTQNALKQAKEMGWLDNVKQYQKIDEKQVEQIQVLTEKSRTLLSKSLVDDFDFTDEAANIVAGFGGTKNEEIKGVKMEDDAVLLVSLSMPPKMLISAMRMSESHGIPIYLNGMIKGSHTLTDTYKALLMLAKKGGVKPKIAINPIVFREYNVTVVPAIIVKKGSRSAIKYGMLNVPYVIEQAEDTWLNEKDNDIELPTVGKLFLVEEMDLIEQMKNRFAKIDWEEKQKKAAARFWDNVTLVGLPQATKDETWFIDPTVHITKDIKNAQGEVIAKAGETKNPLKQFPMMMTYFIVDPTNEEQIAWLTGQLNHIRGQFQVMITHLDKKRGWDHFTEIRKTFNVPIFVMPKEVVQRFKVKASPSKVTTTTDGYLKVQQYFLEDLSHDVID